MRKPKRGNASADNVIVGDAGDVAAKPDDAGNDGNADSGAATASGPAAIDPTTAEQPDSGSDDQPRRRRGRPPGSGAGERKTKPIPLNVTGLERLLVGIHGGLAIISQRHEWSLHTDAKIFDGKTEAEFLAQSVADVSRHYGGIADQKTLDWLNLIQCLAIVYGGRIYAIRSTPRPKVVKPTAADFAVRPNGQAPQHHTPPPTNSFDPTGTRHTPITNSFDPNAGVGEIAGVGAIEFPDGHPLKPKMN